MHRVRTTFAAHAVELAETPRTGPRPAAWVMAYSNGLRHAALSDVGRRRKNNQDSFRVVLASDEPGWRLRGHVFMVADGMGAHAAGELASKLAVDYVPHLYGKYRELSPPEALQRALQEANAEVHRRGEANIDFHNMGTTASVLVLLPQGALVAHIGDSRVYRLRGEHLEQLTFDHSVVWELRKQGQSAGNLEAAQSYYKNVITRSLGPNAQVQVDVEGPFPIEPGDCFLLCSDGLSGQVADEEMGAVLSSFAPDDAAQLLIDLANLRGGPDNITVLVVRVEDPSASSLAGGYDPLTVGGGPRRKVPVAVWIASLVLAFVAAVLGLSGALIPAAVAAVGALATLVVGLVLRSAYANRGEALGDDRRLGEGPYTRSSARPTPEFLQQLNSMAQELRTAAVEQQWSGDLKEFDRLCLAAQEELRAGKAVSALQAYGRAVHHVMRAAKGAKRKRSSDSALDP